VGYASLQDNTTGHNNTAIGFETLDNNTTGYHNVAVGNDALGANTTAHLNTAIGTQSLQTNTTGEKNSAVGQASMRFNTTGSSNTASGYQSLYSNTTGNYNACFGRNAGLSITTGEENICIGYHSGVESQVFTLTTQNARVVMGSKAITNAYIKVAWTVTSDARDKMNFEEVPHGLDFVNNLQPFKYNFKKSRDDATPYGNARYGFKAQDILALEGDNPIIIDNENEDNLKYQGEALVPVLVNAIKELTARLEALENS
jgi:hypothetical protein